MFVFSFSRHKKSKHKKEKRNSDGNKNDESSVAPAGLTAPASFQPGMPSELGILLFLCKIQQIGQMLSLLGYKFFTDLFGS